MLAALLVVALFLDRLCGEPPAVFHPVCWLGFWARRVEHLLHPQNNCIWRAFFAGGLALLLVSLPFVLTAFLLTHAALQMHPLLGFGMTSFCLYLCLAPRSLAEHALRVAGALEENELQSARLAVSMLVGRNTDVLDAHGIARACIESVGENLTDGVTATLFWATAGALMGGLPVAATAAALHRSVNSLDALWGKRNERYRHFGTCAARLDDALNFFPARLTLPAVVLAALFLRPALCPRQALLQGWRFRRAHASPNSAWSEAAFAGALKLKLGGPVWYQDLHAPYPYMGTGSLEATPRHIRLAVKLMWVSTICFAILMACVWV